MRTEGARDLAQLTVGRWLRPLGVASMIVSVSQTIGCASTPLPMTGFLSD